MSKLKLFSALVIVAFVFFFQLHKIHSGLPYHYELEEPQVLLMPFSMLTHLNLHSDLAVYPPVVSSMIAPVTALKYLQDKTRGKVKSTQDYVLINTTWDTHLAHLLHYCRMLISAVSALSILLAFFIGQMLFSFEAGILSALLLGSYNIYLESARIVHPNGIMGFMCLVVLFWTCLYFNIRKRKYILLAGIFSGLAVQTNYNLWVTLVPILLCLALEILEDGLHPENTRALASNLAKGLLGGVFSGNPFFLWDKTALNRWGWKHGLIFAGVFFALGIATKYSIWAMMIPVLILISYGIIENPLWNNNNYIPALVAFIGLLAGFIAGNPYFFTDRNFLSWAIANYRIYQEAGGPHLFNKLFNQIILQNRWACYSLLLIFVPLMTERWKKTVLLLSFPVAYYLYVGSQRYPGLESTFIAIYPFLALVAGVGISESFRRLVPSRHAPWAAGLLGILIVYPSYRGYALDMLIQPWFFRYSAFEKYNRSSLTQNDRRQDMVFWINHHLPPGSRIAVDRNLPFYVADLDPRFTILPFDYIQSSILDLLKQDVDYALMEKNDSPQNKNFCTKLSLLKQFDGQKRSVLENGTASDANLACMLLELKREDLFKYLPNAELISDTQVLPLESFKTEFPFGTTPQDSSQFEIFWLVGAERELLLKRGKYHLELTQFSNDFGQKKTGYPLIGTKISRVSPELPNASFEQGTLNNWTAEGGVFKNQPVFLVGNPSSNISKDNLFYINTEINIEKRDFMNGHKATKSNFSEAQGTLTSKTFLINASKLSFYLVGENHENLNFVEYTFFSKGRVFLRERVYPTEKPVLNVVDLRGHAGQMCQLSVHKGRKEPLKFSGVRLIKEIPLGMVPVAYGLKTYRYHSFEIPQREEVRLRIGHEADTDPNSSQPIIRAIKLVKEKD